MKEKSFEDLPDINFRIKSIIDQKFNGNVRKFSQHIGLSDSSRINRLFNKDNRYQNYPSPSLDLIILISNALHCSTDYLIHGEDKHISNIDIDARKKIINGNGNIMTDDGDVSITKESKDYIDIIKKQQDQIESLIKFIAESK